MATKKISALTSIGTIDPANDVLPIVDTSLATTNKVTPNALFGITGSVVGTSDTQNITNKTLDNTNALTVKDTNLTLQDDGDATKQVKFQLSGVTTGNTRTLTVPNASVTLASLTGTEILTNKTITSPAITGGTIDNTTITVDSISGHTSSTIVTVGGVQMTNGTIGTAGAVVTASIAAGAVVPNSLLASSGTGWAYQSWTPVWVNLTVGNGSVVAHYVQTGKKVDFWLSLIWGSTTSASASTITFTLPVAATSTIPSQILGALPIGVATMTRQGTATYTLFVILNSTTTVKLGTQNATATFTTETDATSTTPNTWLNTDLFAITGSYEVN